jgi:hypothetical protein
LRELINNFQWALGLFFGFLITRINFYLDKKATRKEKTEENKEEIYKFFVRNQFLFNFTHEIFRDLTTLITNKRLLR